MRVDAVLPALAKLSFGSILRRLGQESFGVFVFNPAALVLLRSLVGEPRSAAESLLLWLLAVPVAYAAARAVRRFAPALVP